MPSYTQDFTKIEDLRKKAAAANQAGSILTGTSKTFADTIRENFRNHIAQQGTDTLAQAMGNTAGQLVTEPANLRARTSGVNPLDQDAMAARQQGQSLNTLVSLGQIDKTRTDTIEGVIGAGTNRLVAEAEKKKAEADAAKEEADNILEYVKFKETQSQNAFDRQYKMAQLAEAGTEKEKTKKESLLDLNNDLQNGATLTDVIDSYKDVLSANEIREIYNTKSTWGPMKESMSQYNRMYQSAKKGTGANDLLAALPNSQQKPIIESSKSLVAGTDIMTAIRKDLGDKTPTFLNAIANKNYGVARKILQPYLNTGEIGALIDATQAGLRQQIYGSAFTETEAKLAKLWLTESSDQANQMWVKLLGQQKYGENNIRTAFKARGYSDEEINRYLESIGFSVSNSAGASQDEWADTGRTK